MPTRPSHRLWARVGAAARWTLATLACLWLALCTSVGPLYWSDRSIADFGAINALYFVVAFVAYFAIIVLLVRWAKGLPLFGWHRIHTRRDNHKSSPKASFSNTSDIPTPGEPGAPNTPSPALRRPRHLLPTAMRMRLTSWAISAPGQAVRRFMAAVGRGITRATNRRWKLALILFLGWLWAPATLLAAFGADVRSQIREFSWAWNQWTGLKQPYIGFFSFVPMDIYPTAHYLWPDTPTYLTDQHNIVLTLLYGSVASVSRYLTGSNDWGLVVLAAAQMLFAVCCCAAAAHRFLNRPWKGISAGKGWLRRGDSPLGCPLDRLARPESSPAGSQAGSQAGARLLTLAFFLFCPLAVFSTISLTKSPLFAFSFVWWFSIWYELHDTRRADAPNVTIRPSARTVAAFAAATSVMLVSAKYAWYIVALQIVLAILADRKRWTVYVTALLLPVVLIHGGTVAAINSGAVISGDPIESRGLQLQMIARVAKLDPKSIPQSAKDKLEPVFNLDQMADAYSYQDADPVKSSGIQSKKVSYKWRSVTPEDMQDFNAAWLEIVTASPVVAFDAFLAKCFGYFDVADLPYVPMSYYVNSSYVQDNSTWIKYYNHDWRDQVVEWSEAWSRIPVLGWFTHGNFYVIATLLLGAAEVLLRRWRTLAWHMPLLLLMGVMITAPADNFERHMLPVAFVFLFLCMTFARDSAQARSAARASVGKSEPEPTAAPAVEPAAGAER